MRRYQSLRTRLQRLQPEAIFPRCHVVENDEQEIQRIREAAAAAGVEDGLVFLILPGGFDDGPLCADPDVREDGLLCELE